MTDSNSFASLSSSLLARKGQARPAMRPQALQIQNNSEASHAILDDLGWNDMGHDVPPAGIPAAEPVSLHGFEPLPHAEVPTVVQQQDALAARYAADHYAPSHEQPEIAAPLPMSGINPGFVARTASDPVSQPVQPVVRAAAGSRAKSAFTLRLDSARHLHLRLVCAVNHRSAQQIVTQALDEFLARQPSSAELDSRTHV